MWLNKHNPLLLSKLLATFNILILIVFSNVTAQNFSHNDFRSYCGDGVLVGVPGNDSIDNKIYAFHSTQVPITFDLIPDSSSLNGIGGELGDYTNLAYTTTDTLTIIRYAVSWFEAEPIDTIKIHIPHILTMKRSRGAFWVFNQLNQNINILKVQNQQIVDTIQMNIVNILLLENGITFNSNNYDLHVAGLKADSSLHYYKINTHLSEIDFELALDSSKGQLEFVSGNSQKSFFVFQNEDSVSIIDYYINEDSLHTTLLHEDDELTNVSLYQKMSNYHIALVSTKSDSTAGDTLSTVKLFHIDDWLLADTYYFDLKVKNLFSAVADGFLRILEFEKENERFIVPISSYNQVDLQNSVKIPDEGSVQYSLMYFCFSSVEEIPSDTFEFNFYPNPAKDEITFEFNLDSYESTFTYTLTDMMGKTILKGNLSGKDAQTISVKNIPAGLYIVSIYSDEKKFNRKLILQ